MIVRNIYVSKAKDTKLQVNFKQRVIFYECGCVSAVAPGFKIRDYKD